MAKHRAKDTSKSAVSNGTRLWPTDAQTDGRGVGARRMRDVMTALAYRLNRSFEELDAVRSGHVRRAAALTLALENDEARLASGAAIDMGVYLGVLDRLNGVLERLGLTGRVAMTPEQQQDADLNEMIGMLDDAEPGPPRRRLRDRIVDPDDDGVVYVRPARSEADE